MVCRNHSVQMQQRTETLTYLCGFWQADNHIGDTEMWTCQNSFSNTTVNRTGALLSSLASSHTSQIHVLRFMAEQGFEHGFPTHPSPIWCSWYPSEWISTVCLKFVSSTPPPKPYERNEAFLKKHPLEFPFLPHISVFFLQTSRKHESITFHRKIAISMQNRILILQSVSNRIDWLFLLWAPSKDFVLFYPVSDSIISGELYVMSIFFLPLTILSENRDERVRWKQDLSKMFSSILLRE